MARSDYAVGRSGSEAAQFAGYVGLEQRIERSVIAHPGADAQVVQTRQFWRGLADSADCVLAGESG